ncbi:5-formyltetrahydrofolate cyclo-ligase [Mycolicibacterium sediminis]|uniref:5-formyltetrahydrofolate cyclo-ligase n=1 Tax=Mycolicibacterium sediminis TaxID=1286180 RepID=A0A7I7R0M9_9MYCO|nr:5-formyltetrahydrofolate cyclo-ligase [Mycolicibacterium sediminis]BBY31716.1 5-formyltetrahydrofolate cyclo-ligase [Mycolicibacterium sediminis]
MDTDGVDATADGSTKADLRTAILRSRRAVPADRRRVEAAALARFLRDTTTAGDVACAYVPVGSEPGSVDMLDGLLRAGTRVLLPVAREHDGVPQPLGWGEYRPGGLVEARFGLLEPPPPTLDAGAIGSATVIVVPALAVDRAGIRLGRGAGYYDRSLPLADPAARLIAVVRDEELVDALPGEPHDVAMTHALTPGHGVVRLQPA